MRSVGSKSTFRKSAHFSECAILATSSIRSKSVSYTWRAAGSRRTASHSTGNWASICTGAGEGPTPMIARRRGISSTASSRISLRPASARSAKSLTPNRHSRRAAASPKPGASQKYCVALSKPRQFKNNLCLLLGGLELERERKVWSPKRRCSSRRQNLPRPTNR